MLAGHRKVFPLFFVPTREGEGESALSRVGTGGRLE